MRKALVVGIDYYTTIRPLKGCVNDARAVNALLKNNGDGTPNFDVTLLTATSEGTAIDRARLKDNVASLFGDDYDIALLYFAGHGHVEATGGYLCVSDCQRGDDGLSLAEVTMLAAMSRARNTVIVLDSCHSGIAGSPLGRQAAELREGMTILTASTEAQYANEDEEKGSGVFTSLFVDALNGAASDLVGNITPASVYAHIDKSLGDWQQRPVFKTNIKRFVSLRTVSPPIDRSALMRLTELFPEPGLEFALDPSFEPEIAGRPAGAPAPNPSNTAKFAILQSYNRIGLLVPVNAPHMWHAAMQSKSCKLTVLGEHYRRLVEKNLLK
jgi:caspase domain-containing protein